MKILINGQAQEADDTQLSRRQADERMFKRSKQEQTSRIARLQRLNAYPSIGDQLDALYKARQGDVSDLAALDRQISEIKQRYPVSSGLKKKNV